MTLRERLRELFIDDPGANADVPLAPDQVNRAVTVLRAERTPPAMTDRRITTTDIIGELPLDLAAKLIGTLKAAAQANPVIEVALESAKPNNGGIQLNHTSTQGVLASFIAAGYLTADEVTTINAMAMRSSPGEFAVVTVDDVNRAWENK